MIHEDEPIQHAHISYKDYKKIVNRNPRQGLIMFISVFCVLLIVFLGLAKVMSPDVEINLGDETAQTEDEYVKPGEVDERLKEIHMEDNSEAIGGDGLTITDGGKVVIPKKNNSSETEASAPVYQEETPVYTEESSTPEAQMSKKVEEAPAKTTTAVQSDNSAPIPHYVGIKVVVGSYSTIEQAQVAKGILSEAGLGLSPFIRRIGNEYTLQTGSYTTKEKAMDAARALLEKNYPARVLIEQ